MAQQPKPFTPVPRLSFSHARTKPVVVEKVKRSAPAMSRRPDDERRRALAALAENPDGCSRVIMLARGFSLALLNRLVRAGFATSHVEREQRGEKAIEIVRLRITEVGRRAL